jgi:hypothetical protein
MKQAVTRWVESRRDGQDFSFTASSFRCESVVTYGCHKRQVLAGSSVANYVHGQFAVPENVRRKARGIQKTRGMIKRCLAYVVIAI